MHLPVELLLMVCKDMEKTDLKNLRLVCKSLEPAAAAILFQAVALSTNGSEMETAQRKVNRFGPYMRTLSFSSAHYPAITYAQFKREWRSGRLFQRLDHQEKQHLELSYGSYCETQQKQEHDLKTGFTLAYLCAALLKMPALRNVILKGSAPLPIRKKSNHIQGKRQESGLICPVPGCGFSDDDHLQYQIQPNSGLLAPIADTWSLLMLAIWTTRLGLESIEMEINPRFQGPPGLPARVFDERVQRPYTLQGRFRNLTRLELQICLDDDVNDGHCFWQGHIARAVAAANRLEYLFIMLDYAQWPRHNSTMLRATFDGCVLKRVKQLKLEGFSSTSEELSALIWSSPELEKLTIYEHELSSGTWEKFATDTKAYGSSTLRSISLDDLFNGFGGSGLGPEGIQSENLADDINAFFFGDGVNPFTNDAFEKYRHRNLEQGLDWYGRLMQGPGKLHKYTHSACF